MSDETDYTETWTALEQAEEALNGVRAAHLGSEEHEMLLDARETLEQLRNGVDAKIEHERGENE